MVVCRNRNSVAIIPNRHNHRHLQSTRRIDSFPKMPFCRRCISDCPKSHFLPIVGEFFRALEFHFFIDIRRQSQSKKSRHLPCCRRYIGRNIFNLCQILPASVFIQRTSRKMARHLSPCRSGFALHISICIELSEKRIHTQNSHCHRKSLVTVIS